MFHRRRCSALASTLTLALVACPAALGGTLHEVQQNGLSFVPADIEVAPGDTIRWVWTMGSHTVTSGTDCTFDGVFFNEPLGVTNPVVEWTVPGDAPELIPYFCQPHCLFDMIGSIAVLQDAPCRGDLNDDGETGFGDLLSLLALWGACDDCDADLDDNGMVDFSDLLQLLSTWGPCP